MRTSGTHLSLVGEAAAEIPLAVRSDDELALLARGGLTEAFDVLVRRYQERVLRLAARQLGNSAAAKDVAQSAFLAVYRALPRYQPREKFGAYLFRTVLNECRMVRRWHLLRGRIFTSSLASSDQPEPIAPTPSAEAQILARERERDLAAAVNTLSAKLRDVVSLRYGAELGYEEIAETLSVPVGTVKRRLFDALEKLRSELGES